MPEPGTSPIAIAGLTPFSMVDWPGHLVATVFTQGCSWNCPYCQNPQLLDITSARAGLIAWEEVMGLARRRVGLLDGFVFSGGEPTRHRRLADAMKEIREMGYAVGLHTNGMYPSALREILDAGVVDWVGLDIKAANCAYGEAIGAVSDVAGAAAAKHAWESLELLQAWVDDSPDGKDFEVRTSVFDCPEQLRTLGDLAKQLSRASVRTWAVQRSRNQGTAPEFVAAADVVKPERQREITAAIKVARCEFPGVLVR